MFSSLMFQGVHFSPTTAVTAPSVPRTLYMRSGLYQGWVFIITLFIYFWVVTREGSNNYFRISSYIVSSNLFVCSREIFRYRYMPILPSRTEVNYASRKLASTDYFSSFFFSFLVKSGLRIRRNLNCHLIYRDLNDLISRGYKFDTKNFATRNTIDTVILYL